MIASWMAWLTNHVRAFPVQQQLDAIASLDLGGDRHLERDDGHAGAGATCAWIARRPGRIRLAGRIVAAAIRLTTETLAVSSDPPPTRACDGLG